MKAGIGSGPERQNAWKKRRADSYPKEITRARGRLIFANGIFTFQAETPSKFIRMLKPYNLKDTAAKIKCTMLVVDSEEDKDLPGQARQLFEALRCPKEYMLFTKAEGAEEHCQMGAVMISNERILDWLETALMKKKGTEGQRP